MKRLITETEEVEETYPPGEDVPREVPEMHTRVQGYKGTCTLHIGCNGSYSLTSYKPLHRYHISRRFEVYNVTFQEDLRTFEVRTADRLRGSEIGVSQSIQIESK